MELVLSGLVVLALLTTIAGLLRLREARRRRLGSVPPSGASVLREARSVPVRLFVERSVPGGPRGGGINRSPADLVLTEQELVVSTGKGRVLLINAGRQGKALSTGPQRLVLEGLHPARDVKVRAELLVEDPAPWVAGVAALRAAGGG